MENIEKIQEEITTSVESVTVDISVRVRLSSINDAPFEFTSSIDEVGQIVLTPTTKEVAFESANTDSNIEYDIPVAEQETIVTKEDIATIKETSIFIRADMLKEDDNIDVSADVDEIGQCVIYPLSKNNTFVTAAIEDHLNLVTEDMKVVDYFGYKLINAGDGWDIRDSNGELVEEGVATESAAKVLVCKEEIHRLEAMTEELNEPENVIDVDTHDAADADINTTEEDNKELPVPDVKAEVIEESVSEDSVFDILRDITNEFTEDGAIKCTTLEEKDKCIDLLKQHYSDVTCTEDENYIVVFIK